MDWSSHLQRHAILAVGLINIAVYGYLTDCDRHKAPGVCSNQSWQHLLIWY
jgi:hypothetical protein